MTALDPDTLKPLADFRINAGQLGVLLFALDPNLAEDYIHGVGGLQSGTMDLFTLVESEKIMVEVRRAKQGIEWNLTQSGWESDCFRWVIHGSDTAFNVKDHREEKTIPFDSLQAAKRYCENVNMKEV